MVAIADESSSTIMHLKVGIASRYMLRATRVSQQSDVVGHFRPIYDFCAMSAFYPIATKLLHYSK